MCYVQSCPPKEAIFGGSKGAISEKFCGIFFLLVLVYLINLGKVEERANQVLAHKKYYILLFYYIPILVRATFGQLSSISFSKFIFNIKDKGEKVSSLQSLRLPRSRRRQPLGWLRTNHCLAIGIGRSELPFF